MAISEEYRTYLEDLFSVMPDVTIRRMFGGVGIFRHGLMFALSPGAGGLAFKVDGQTIGRFREAESSEWVYETPSGQSKGMGYWYAPERVLEDEEEFRTWALEAFEAACRIDAGKPPAQRKLSR